MSPFAFPLLLLPACCSYSSLWKLKCCTQREIKWPLSSKNPQLQNGKTTQIQLDETFGLIFFVLFTKIRKFRFMTNVAASWFVVTQVQTWFVHKLDVCTWRALAEWNANIIQYEEGNPLRQLPVDSKYQNKQNYSKHNNNLNYNLGNVMNVMMMWNVWTTISNLRTFWKEENVDESDKSLYMSSKLIICYIKSYRYKNKIFSLLSFQFTFLLSLPFIPSVLWMFK